MNDEATTAGTAEEVLESGSEQVIDAPAQEAVATTVGEAVAPTPSPEDGDKEEQSA